MRVGLAKSIFQLGNKSCSSSTKYMGGINNGNYLLAIRSKPVKLQSQYGRSRVLSKLLEASEEENYFEGNQRGN
jgi:hypothetical protein